MGVTGGSSIDKMFNTLNCMSKRAVRTCVLCVMAAVPVCTIIIKTINHPKAHKRKRNMVNKRKAKLNAGLPSEMVTFLRKLACLSQKFLDNIPSSISGRIFTARKVLAYFQKRAIQADAANKQELITDFYPDAESIAETLDQLPTDRRRRLHGVPIAVQENANELNCVSFLHCVSRQPDKFHNVVEALKTEGMVPFVRTAILKYCGPFRIPYECRAVCQIIDEEGSKVEIAADIGGSVRVPTCYSYLYCLKPTSARIARRRCWRDDINYISYQAVVSPISANMDYLVDIMRTLFSHALFDLDRSLPRLPFGEAIFQSDRPLKIGFYEGFSENYLGLECVPIVRDAINQVRWLLSEHSNMRHTCTYTLVKWEPPRIAYACDLVRRCHFRRDRDKFFRKEELVLPAAGWCSIKSWKIILAESLWRLSPRLCQILLKTVCRSQDNILSLIDEARAYREECDRAWDEAGIDCLICPVFPFMLPLSTDPNEYLYGTLYSNLYSFLDYPAGVVPCTIGTRKDDLNFDRIYQAHVDAHWLNAIKKQRADGTYVGVQCVAKKWNDEIVLRLMMLIKKVFHQ